MSLLSLQLLLFSFSCSYSLKTILIYINYIIYFILQLICNLYYILYICVCVLLIFMYLLKTGFLCVPPDVLKLALYASLSWNSEICLSVGIKRVCHHAWHYILFTCKASLCYNPPWFELMDVLPQSPECWAYRCVLTHLAQSLDFIGTMKSSVVLHKTVQNCNPQSNNLCFAHIYFISFCFASKAFYVGNSFYFQCQSIVSSSQPQFKKQLNCTQAEEAIKPVNIVNRPKVIINIHHVF